MRLRPLTKKRLIGVLAGGVVGAVALGVTPFIVLDQLSLSLASAAHSAAISDLDDAVADIAGAQEELFAANTAATSSYDDVGVFLSVLRKDLLRNPALAADLASARESLRGLAKLTESPMGTLAPDRGVEPRTPSRERPADLGALRNQAQKLQAVADEYSEHAVTLTELSGAVVASAGKLDELVEKTLASARAFATGAKVRSFSKATPQAKTALSNAAARLDDTGIDPTTRFTGFASAYDALVRSHKEVVAEEKAEAARKLEQERLAELEKKRLEEEARKKEEEALKPTPTPTPEPTPTPTPTPEPTPTPAPTPEG